MPRYLLAIVMAIFTGCISQHRVEKNKPLLVLDNSGGYSHGGQRIELFERGVVSITSYSDVVGDRSISKGQYELHGNVLKLRFGDRGNRSLHRISYRGSIYWVYPGQVKEIGSPEGASLRKTSLKQQEESKP